MTLRNKLFLAIIASIPMLAACSDLDEQSRDIADDSNAITFATSSGDSRAVGTLDAEGLKANGFGVFAYYTGTSDWEDRQTSSSPNFMNNQLVSQSGNKWNYSPTKYWPKNTQEKISYFAYAPYTSNTSYVSTANGYPTIAYEIVDQSSDLKTSRMWDLVVARNIDVAGRPLNSTDKTVKLSFKHVTSRLTFNARLSNYLSQKGAKVYISDIFVYGIYRYAKYSIAADQWMNRIMADSVDFTNRLNRVDYQINENTTLTGVELLSSAATNVFSEIPYMFMIPHNGIMRIKFNYFLVNGSSYEKKTAELTISKNFEEGHAYALNVTFGSNGITGGEDNDNGGSDNSADTGLGYIEANGGAYYLHHGWIWDYQEDYMFQKTSDGKYTLTLGGNPGVFYVLKKQGAIEYTDIYGLGYGSEAYTFDFNKTYTIEHSSNVTTWSVQNMVVKDADYNNVYRFTFDPDVPSIKIEQIDPGDNTFVIPPTTITNSTIDDQTTALDGTPVSTLKNMSWYLFHNGNYSLDDGVKFKNLGNGLHTLEVAKLYPFHLCTYSWVYSLGNSYWGKGTDQLVLDVPHRAVFGANSIHLIYFADADYIENATIIVDFNHSGGPIITVNGIPRYL